MVLYHFFIIMKNENIHEVQIKADNNKLIIMTKKANKYKLTLEQVSLMKEDSILSEPIVLEF